MFCRWSWRERRFVRSVRNGICSRRLGSRTACAAAHHRRQQAGCSSSGQPDGSSPEGCATGAGTSQFTPPALSDSLQLDGRSPLNCTRLCKLSFSCRVSGRFRAETKASSDMFSSLLADSGSSNNASDAPEGSVRLALALFKLRLPARQLRHRHWPRKEKLPLVFSSETGRKLRQNAYVLRHVAMEASDEKMRLYCAREGPS